MTRYFPIDRFLQAATLGPLAKIAATILPRNWLNWLNADIEIYYRTVLTTKLNQAIK